MFKPFPNTDLSLKFTAMFKYAKCYYSVSTEYVIVDISFKKGVRMLKNKKESELSGYEPPTTSLLKTTMCSNGETLSNAHATSHHISASLSPAVCLMKPRSIAISIHCLQHIPISMSKSSQLPKCSQSLSALVIF